MPNSELSVKRYSSRGSVLVSLNQDEVIVPATPPCTLVFSVSIDSQMSKFDLWFQYVLSIASNSPIPGNQK